MAVEAGSAFASVACMGIGLFALSRGDRVALKKSVAAGRAWAAVGWGFVVVAIFAPLLRADAWSLWRAFHDGVVR